MLKIQSKNILGLLIFCLFSASSFAQPAMGTSSFATASSVSLNPTGVCTGGKTGTIAGYTFSIFSAENCAINNATGTGSDGHVNLFATPAITGIWQQGRFASSDGSEFKLENFVFSVLTTPFIGKTITVTGYRDGVFVPGASAVSAAIIATGLTNNLTVNVTSNTAFNNVDEIRLTPSGTDAQGTFTIQAITISPALTTLPVTFLRVDAHVLENALRINFSTADESNIDHYEVQVSQDGINFTHAKTMTANNSSLNHYETRIAKPNSDIWIRIKSIELNGDENLSGIIYKRVTSANEKNLSVYPNPAQQIVYIDNQNNEMYTITNLLGMEIQKGKIINQQIDVRSLSNGIYILKVNNQSVKLYKQ